MGALNPGMEAAQRFEGLGVARAEASPAMGAEKPEAMTLTDVVPETLEVGASALLPRSQNRLAISP